MAADQITFTTNTRKVNERSVMSVVARFRNRASAADVTPTNVAYRLDTCGGQIRDWTSVTPSAGSATITLTAADNAIQNDARGLERRTLTVCSDRGLSTQYLDYMQYEVRNLPLIQT